jgi:hypothetical protein
VSSEAVDAILVLTIAGVLVPPIAGRVRVKRFDPFEPIVVFTAAYGVMCVVRPAAMLAKSAIFYAGPTNHPRRLRDLHGDALDCAARSGFGRRRVRTHAAAWSPPYGERRRLGFLSDLRARTTRDEMAIQRTTCSSRQSSCSWPLIGAVFPR